MNKSPAAICALFTSLRSVEALDLAGAGAGRGVVAGEGVGEGVGDDLEGEDSLERDLTKFLTLMVEGILFRGGCLPFSVIWCVLSTSDTAS